MFLTNWIDKKIEEIQGDIMFKKHFNGVEVQEIEGAFYLFNPESGIDIVLSDVLVVQSIHLFAFSGKHKGYESEIPMGLIFSMSQSTIKEKLGEPAKSGGGYRDILCTIPMWDKYFFKGFSLHLQYSEWGSKIDLITIGSLRLEAYFNIGLQ
jgi:hypothetical protein